MLLRNTKERYGAIAATLHWIFVVAFIGQYVLSNLMESTPPGPEKWAWYGWHKSIGMTILFLAVIRLGWKLSNPAPTLNFIPKLERLAVHAGHIALYIIIIGFPLSGYLMSMAGGYGVNMFGLWEVPDLIGKNPEIGKLANQAHHFFTKAVYVVVGIHILAALRHHFILKDNILRRMLPVKLK